MCDIGIYTTVTKATMLIQKDTTLGSQLINCWLSAAGDTRVEALHKTGHIDAALAINRKSDASFAKSDSFGSFISRV
jgi:hypothetical protein